MVSTYCHWRAGWPWRSNRNVLSCRCWLWTSSQPICVIIHVAHLNPRQCKLEIIDQHYHDSQISNFKSTNWNQKCSPSEITLTKSWWIGEVRGGSCGILLQTGAPTYCYPESANIFLTVQTFQMLNDGIVTSEKLSVEKMTADLQQLEGRGGVEVFEDGEVVVGQCELMPRPRTRKLR